MPLDLDAIYCAARIVGDVRNPRTHLSVRGVCGTGFFLTVPSETLLGVRHTYLLTANHVIEGQANVEVEVPDAVTGVLLPPTPVRDWRQPFKHVDLALAPVARAFPGRRFSIRLEDQVLPEHETATPGAIVYYIGHFTPLDRVMARSGTVGALDQEGLPLGEYSYPAHLVDCRSYRGFSGSPCFVDVAYAELEERSEIHVSLPLDIGPVGDLIHVVMLCGMFTAHLTDEAKEEEPVSRYGVGVMLRSEEIRKALMTDELRKERSEADEAHKAAEAGDRPRLEQAGGKRGEEFDRFENLTRKLVNVPKKELDEQRKDEG
jgi:hypothetical protein